MSSGLTEAAAARKSCEVLLASAETNDALCFNSIARAMVTSCASAWHVVMYALITRASKSLPGIGFSSNCSNLKKVDAVTLLI